jgi:DNA-directed RNA polymerase subunit alpha
MISLPTIAKIIDKKENKATFQIEALYPGFGVTLGNSLRRVLLSSLPGAAVTGVKIKGVSHEFSTLPGVLEDVISILLNLKQLRFKMYSQEPQKATLKVKGEGKVKASDFKVPSQVELVNKDLHIATLISKNAELEIEIEIEKGIGYSPREARKKEKLVVGEIALDAIFTPIRRVAFRVENIRKGERTDFDRLLVEVETDGTITPEEAFSKAAEILQDHFSFLKDSFRSQEKVKEKNLSSSEKELLLEDLKFSKKTLKILTENKITKVNDLLKESEKSLSQLKGLGDKGIKEIKRKLKKFNLKLQT